MLGEASMKDFDKPPHVNFEPGGFVYEVDAPPRC